MRVASADQRYRRSVFEPPLRCGFIYLGIAIDPPRRSPFVRPSTRRRHVISELAETVRELQAHPGVVRAKLYQAVLIGPTRAGRPRYDVVILIHTSTPHAIATVQAAQAYQRLAPALSMTMLNARRFGDTDTTDSAYFLFNHFTADDADEAMRVWEGVAGWFTAKTGVDNTTLLQSTDTTAPYPLVNYVRLPGGPARFLLGQFIRRSFYSFVRHQLRTHGMNASPIIATPVRERVNR